jgi:hypothetical protein
MEKRLALGLRVETGSCEDYVSRYVRTGERLDNRAERAGALVAVCRTIFVTNQSDIESAYV